MVKTRGMAAGGGLKFASGTYVGNGAASRDIHGLTTFRSKIVYAYAQREIGSINDQWCTHLDVVDAAGVGGESAMWFPQWVYDANGITDIFDDGFQVSLLYANQNGVTYTWIAFG